MPLDGNVALLQELRYLLLLTRKYDASTALLDPRALAALIAGLVYCLKDEWFDAFLGFLLLVEVVQPFLFVLGPPDVFSFQELRGLVQQGVGVGPDLLVETVASDVGR